MSAITPKATGIATDRAVAPCRGNGLQCSKKPHCVCVTRRKMPARSPWLQRQESVAVNGEQPSLVFAASAFEGIDWRADFDLDEAGIFQHFLPGCTRQTAGNSSRPKIDVADGGCGHRLAIRNVGELDPSVRT